MIPVVMLVVNIGAFSSVFLDLVSTHYGSSLPPVVYLMGVAVMAIVVIPETRTRFSPVLIVRLLEGTVMTHLALSLLINIYATSIIALKAWCVQLNCVAGRLSTWYALVDETMCTYIQEIPQVADRKRYRYPNP